jgi:hypothetical protein
LNVKDARERYIQSTSRELFVSMKSETIPKGVIFSQFLLSAPLIAVTSYLCLLAPMAANPVMVDPVQFAYLARSSVRLLGLNIAFIGGIHYGLAAANYETTTSDEELKKVKYQMIYSFVPAAMAMGASSFLLFATPLSAPHVVVGFTNLMMT